MNRKANFLTAIGLVTAFLASATGCQLVAAVDRADIEPDSSDDAGIGDDAGDDAGEEAGPGDAGDGDGGEIGVCGEGVTACSDDADCSGIGDVCSVGKCVEGCCELVHKAEGEPVENDQPGDCRKLVCDGNGHANPIDDDTDLPTVDECWVPKCSGGAPANAAKPVGESCGGGSKVCDGAGNCVDPSCTDQVKDGDETDVDCGGSCGPCGDGKACATGSDCTSGVCDSDTNTCAAPACDDEVKNGNETDVDCGGSCDPCDDGKACETGTDCASGVCEDDVCVSE